MSEKRTTKLIHRVRSLVAGGVVTVMMTTGLLATVNSGTAQAAVGPKGIGVVSDLSWYMSRPDMDRSISMMRDAGVQWVRMNMTWSNLEPNTKGVLDPWWMPELDYAVQQAEAAGLKILMPIADGVPYWASADPSKYTDGAGRHWNIYWKPKNLGDYADFAQRIVTRYQAFGVHHYEVWNEPNFVRFWPSGPNPTEYTAMLRAAYPAIKAADPGATVVMGGLSGNDYDFLQGIYDAGGGAYFDAAAVHPYTGGTDPTLCWNEGGRRAKFALCGIEEIRRTMVANGDSRGLWLTEMGWSTSTVANGVSEATQADYLTKAFTKVESYPYVTNTFWYSFRSNWWSNNDPTDLEANYGLVRVDFSLKPAYNAFKSYAISTTGIDTQPATLTGIRSSAIKRTSAVISWTTSEASDSSVEYWPAGATTTTTVPDVRLLLTHQMGLSSLQRGTTYNYRVQSADAAGNRALSATYSFTTLR